jgi:colanic acid biosynthesis glycosyl transferase WcaI
MHILMTTAYFPPDVGSAAHLFYGLGQAFVERGHRVGVVTGFPGYHAQGDLTRYRGRLWMRETMEGMHVYRTRVPQIARDTPVGRGLWQFSCAFSFALAGLRVTDPDVVLVYSPPLSLGLTAWVWQRLRSVPFVFNVQDLFPQSAIDLGVLRQKSLIRFFEGLERAVYRRADIITVHSSGNREHVLSRGGRPETTLVLPNSVDTEHIQPGSRQNGLRNRLGLSEEHFVVSFAGVIGYSQDLDVVLEAADRLRDQGDIRFLLVGDGVEKERLVRKAKEMGLSNVVWMPMQSRERYPDILHVSDVSLATLHADVQTPVVPSKILSIMAAGRPVVAALDLQGDAPKLIAKAEAGYSVEPGQPKSLAESIMRLYKQPDLCKRLGANGRRYVENHLSHQAVAARYEHVFGNVLRR